MVSPECEAAVQSIDLRLREGKSPAAIETELDPGKRANSPLKRFIRAYLIARNLPRLQGDEHAESVAEARELLRGSWSELKDKGEVRALEGAIRFEEFLRTGDPAAAEKANNQYMVALELMQRNPRYKAMILG
jgi:hypothetical protein